MQIYSQPKYPGTLCNSVFFIPDRSPEFSDFLRKALDKNVDNRWGTVQLLQVSFLLCLLSHCAPYNITRQMHAQLNSINSSHFKHCHGFYL